MPLPINLADNDALSWFTETWTGIRREYKSRVQAEIAWQHNENMHKLCYVVGPGHYRVARRRTRYGNELSAVRAEDIGF